MLLKYRIKYYGNERFFKNHKKWDNMKKFNYTDQIYYI